MTSERTKQNLEFLKRCTAQAQYCNDNDVPLLAPLNGLCPGCSSNIYEAISLTKTISLAKAGSTHITECPHCGLSYSEADIADEMAELLVECRNTLTDVLNQHPETFTEHGLEQVKQRIARIDEVLEKF